MGWICLTISSKTIYHESVLVIRTTKKSWSVLWLYSYNLIILSTESWSFRKSNKVFSESLLISENQIQIQASERSEIFGKLPLSHPLDVSKLLSRKCSVTSSQGLSRVKSVQGKLYQTLVFQLDLKNSYLKIMVKINGKRCILICVKVCEWLSVAYCDNWPVRQLHIQKISLTILYVQERVFTEY